MRFRFPSMVAACLLLAACSGQPASDSKKDGDSAGKSDPPQVQVAVKTLEQLEQMIAGHRGKVVVVDLWAIW